MSRRILITGDLADTDLIHQVLADERAQTPPDQFLVILHRGEKHGAEKIADDWAYSQLQKGKKVRCEQFSGDTDYMLRRGVDICHTFGSSPTSYLAKQAGITVIDHSDEQKQ